MEDTLVSTKRYEELMDVEAFMCALEAAGVDNWEGYSIAKGILEEWNKEGV